VFYSTGNNDTAVVGVNYDLSLNEGLAANSTSGWLVFGDSASSKSIILQFVNQAHNSTEGINNVSLSLFLGQCEVFDASSQQWMASSGCSINSAKSTVGLEIVDECASLVCENDGTCIDSGRSQPYCACTAGESHWALLFAETDLCRV
jgi:hypothetical protein